MAKLSDIEGIGPAYTWKLKCCGVETPGQLLDKGGTPADRRALAESTGISDKLIMKWISRADLARIKGVAGEYAGLLECAGIDTVPDLARRDAATLHRKISEVNGKSRLVRSLPSEEQLGGWINQARNTSRAIHY